MKAMENERLTKNVTRKGKQVKPAAGIIFYEEITRHQHGKDGSELNKTEAVNVPMVYNKHGIKIRVQCSSCAKFTTYVGGRTTPTYCKKVKMYVGSNRTEIPDSRGLCSEWEINPLFANIGNGASVGECKSPKYIQWIVANDNILKAKYEKLPLPFRTQISYEDYRRSVYQDTTHEDPYGHIISNNSEGNEG